MSGNKRFVTKTQPMRGVPMARVRDPESGKIIAEGWYAAYPETTFCCAEDYQRNPPRLVEGIVCWQMTDWGLPNKIGFREVTPPHKIELIQQEEQGGEP